MSTPQASDRTVADRYFLRDELGRGGMGTVWRADDDVLKRKVAVKEVAIPASVSPDERRSLRARTLREARAAARLNHPSAVTIYDVREEDGRAYIVMELVEAPTLKDLVERDGPLAPHDAAAIGLDVVTALEEAHRQDIVHRDVKPANVMVHPSGRTKLADFGIAFLKGDPKLTATGMVLGSPQFMAPEQAQGHDAGAETDLWALGASLYYAVEGEPPFDRGQAIPTLGAVVHEEPRPMRRAGALGPVIDALLQKEPADRPSASEVRRLLEDVAAGRQVDQAPGVIVSGAGADTRTEGAPAYVEDTEEERYRSSHGRAAAPTVERTAPSRWWGWATAVVVLAVLAVGVWLLVSNLGRQDPIAGDRTTPAGEANAPAEQPEAAPDDTGQAPAAAVPADWETYTNEGGRYEFRYPAGWQIIPGRGGVSRNVDFQDPETGNYIRVAWTPTPGPSPEGAWESLSASFGESHDNYEEHQITPTTFKGMDAALWEYSWTEGGTDLHAYDLGFITEDRGYALNFVTEEADWESSQVLWRQFKAAFRVSE